MDVNQQLAPSCVRPSGVSDAGVNWQIPSSSFTVGGSTLVVELSNDANGYVLADAISIRSTAPAEIDVTGIDNGDPGFSSTGFGTGAGYGFQSDVCYAPGGSGSSEATWTFRDLAPGNYQVSATWGPHPNRATDAPYTIHDDINAAVVVDVNQRLAPCGVTDAAVNWQVLSSSFTVTGDTLTVRMTNDANGYVIADAIRIQLVVPPPAALLIGLTDIDNVFRDPLRLNL